MSIDVFVIKTRRGCHLTYCKIHCSWPGGCNATQSPVFFGEGYIYGRL